MHRGDNLSNEELWTIVKNTYLTGKARSLVLSSPYDEELYAASICSFFRVKASADDQALVNAIGKALLTHKCDKNNIEIILSACTGDVEEEAMQMVLHSTDIDWLSGYASLDERALDAYMKLGPTRRDLARSKPMQSAVRDSPVQLVAGPYHRYACHKALDFPTYRERALALFFVELPSLGIDDLALILKKMDADDVRRKWMEDRLLLMLRDDRDIEMLIALAETFASNDFGRRIVVTLLEVGPIPTSDEWKVKNLIPLYPQLSEKLEQLIGGVDVIEQMKLDCDMGEE